MCNADKKCEYQKLGERFEQLKQERKAVLRGSDIKDDSNTYAFIKLEKEARIKVLSQHQ